MGFDQVVYHVFQGAAGFQKLDDGRNGIDRMIVDLLDLVVVIDLREKRDLAFYYFRNFAILVISD